MSRKQKLERFTLPVLLSSKLTPIGIKIMTIYYALSYSPPDQSQTELRVGRGVVAGDEAYVQGRKGKGF